MSRPSTKVSTAPLAVASDGSLLMNIAASAGPLHPVKLTERALAEGGKIFVGIVATPKEIRSALKALDDSTAEIASWIWGARHRRRRDMARGRARK
jgi:hypothetical protein